MTALDYVVLVGYFVLMTLIGLWSMLKVKKQEDFFLGSRTFGRVFQTFAAFGAGTGSHDPVTVGRTTFTSGLSGIWSVLLWLFVTPFYWFTAVWYRRMRHITLGDWFVERYQSKGLGAAFMLFAFAFYMVYLALGFTAIGKVGAPLVEVDEVTVLGYTMPIEHALVYICALVVLVYGVLGGLRAAYWTDVIQGVFIILLSVLLIPAGLNALVDKEVAEKNLDPATMSTMDGFRIMHGQVPAEYFEIVESPRGGEFPLYYIVAITLLNLVAIVVHPHMAVTGGGSARTENSARVGLVMGNYLKRLCTIGWCITILIVLAYMAGNVEIAKDPDRTWGVAAREILGPFKLGLVGLMLACLMAALMSSASAYMLVVSALMVRNFYAAYIHKEASEKTYVLLGRIVSALVIVGGVAVSLYYMNIFDQLKIAWEMPILFAASFWIGMFWRRATKWAAWAAFLFAALAFFIVPAVLPVVMNDLPADQRFTQTNDIVTRIVTRPVAQADIGRRQAAIGLWEQKAQRWAEEQAAAKEIGPRPQPIERGQLIDDPSGADGKRAAAKRDVARRNEEIVTWEEEFRQWLERLPEPVKLTDELRQAAAKPLGPCPEPLRLGDTLEDPFTTGGSPIYWKSAVWFDKGGKPHEIVDKKGQFVPVPKEHQAEVLEKISEQEEGNTKVVRQRYQCQLHGRGWFELDFLLYDYLGMDLAKTSTPALATLRLPTRIVLPFVVMILLSLLTPRGDREALDRFYVKMKTPVNPDPAADRAEMEASYRDPSRFDDRRLLPAFGLEIRKPKPLDVAGFLVAFGICFAIIWFTVWVAGLGG